jgi:hypothetical protein
MMAQLTSAQIERLQTALLDAFDQAELAQLVRLELDQNLEAIAAGAALEEIAFNLIQWAERHARTGDLVRGAQRRRPHSRTLQALADELGNAAGEPAPGPAAQPPSAPTSKPGGINIGKIEAVNVGETQHIDQRGAQFNLGEHKEIHTGGGAYVGGNVNTQGDFVGRDKVVHGDEVQGDKVGGDQISVGDVSGTGIAIGRGASANVQTGLSGDELAKALAPVVEAVQRNSAGAATQAAALQQIDELTQELAKGKGANDARIADILDELAKRVPGAVAAVVSTFGTPLLGGLAGPVTQYVLDRLKRGGS